MKCESCARKNLASKPLLHSIHVAYSAKAGHARKHAPDELQALAVRLEAVPDDAARLAHLFGAADAGQAAAGEALDAGRLHDGAAAVGRDCACRQTWPSAQRCANKARPDGAGILGRTGGRTGFMVAIHLHICAARRRRCAVEPE